MMDFTARSSNSGTWDFRSGAVRIWQMLGYSHCLLKDSGAVAKIASAG